MTKEQLLKKWAKKGTRTARLDMWMLPCYEEDLAGGVHPDDLLLDNRDQWQATDHFRIWYGNEMFADTLLASIWPVPIRTLPDPVIVASLKADLLEAFWDAWEDEIDACDLIEGLVDKRPKELASRMLGMLEVVREDCVVFTEEAILQRTPEFQSFVRWTNSKYATLSFMLGQAYYMLDYVESNGLESFEEGIPEADVYTRDLLDWLGGTIHNMAYLTEALSERGNFTDAAALLQVAQSLAMEDAWRGLAQVLKDLLE